MGVFDVARMTGAQALLTVRLDRGVAQRRRPPKSIPASFALRGELQRMLDSHSGYWYILYHDTT
jgi:hypothetical protein